MFVIVILTIFCNVFFVEGSISNFILIVSKSIVESLIIYRIMSNNSSYDHGAAAGEGAVTFYELYELCTSDALSLGALKEKQLHHLLLGKDKEGFNEDYYEYPFFHYACMNKKVTLGIVEYLLSIFPQVGYLKTNGFCPDGEIEAYPLHICCCNVNCPNAIIDLLVEKYPDALRHYCIVDEGVEFIIHDEYEYVKGIPVHYYLERKSNVDIDTVMVLVEAYPQALLAADNDLKIAPIHVAISNPHIDNLLEILVYLLESEPNSIRLRDSSNQTLLHIACDNASVDKAIFQLIYSSWPEALHLRDEYGDLSIHHMCENRNMDDNASLDILRFMLNIDPTLSSEIDGDNEYLPLHYAVDHKSTTFCKELIDAYPQSLRIESGRGMLPIHVACCYGNRDDIVDTIQYMLELDPELINSEDRRRYLSIHLAAEYGSAKSIELLLKFDPNAASNVINDGSRLIGLWLPLHFACRFSTNLSTIQVLYDAYPEAIFTSDSGRRTPLDIARNQPRNQPAIDFLQTQLLYARRAQDMTAMATVDDDGWLPLHRALKDDAPLGSIKLLVRANPAALQVADQNGVYPVHIACEFSSVKVVQYLVELAGDALNNVDAKNNSLFHYACRGGNLGIVKYLLEANMPSVSERNNNNKLAIHLLLECEENTLDIDRESVEYVETVWQLLLANPEVVRDFMSC